MRRETLDAIRANTIAKGDVLGVARLAGIMAAKRTSELIPLCHPIPLSDIRVDITHRRMRCPVSASKRRQKLPRKQVWRWKRSSPCQ